MAADYFEALDLPRRADLDPDAVRAAFHAKSRAAHPDRGGDAGAFSALGEAHACIADPARRLKHLATLELGEPPDAAGAVDPATMSLFETVGSALGLADIFLKASARASSAVAKALLANDAAAAASAVFAASGAVRARKAELIGRFADIDRALGAGEKEAARGAIGECARALAFLGKWEAQLADRMAAMAA